MHSLFNVIRFHYLTPSLYPDKPKKAIPFQFGGTNRSVDSYYLISKKMHAIRLVGKSIPIQDGSVALRAADNGDIKPLLAFART
jgi:hypothetical protein